MQPHSLPRSLGSIDLTNHPALSSSSSASSDHHAFAAGPSHPSFLVTDSSANDVMPSSLTDEQYLAKMTSATRTLLAHPSSQSSGHLSSSYPATSGKALSRISEYSESAYSADGATSARNSREPQGLTPSASTQTVTSESSSSAPTNPSFLFPAPPSHAPLSSSDPEPSAALSYSHYAAPALPGSPQRSHLPSRPITALTTPLPTSNPAPVPVPIVNFANPAAEVRSDSPYAAVMLRANGAPAAKEVMVQLPGRAVTTGPNAAYQSHESKPSDATTWTASGMTLDSMDKDAGAGAYDTISLAPSGSSTAGGASHHRFTLDHHEKPRGAALGGAQGWEKEGGRRKGNKRLLWCLLLLAVVGAAVGVGVGVGAKKHSSEKSVQADAGAAAAESSSSASSSSPLQTLILPSTTAAASASSTDDTRSSASRTATAVPTYSTTFAYGTSGRATVVPLTYTIPSSYDTRENGQWQFTEAVVLPSLSGSGSFTSELRFRVAPTGTAVARKKRDLGGERRRDVQEETRGKARRWERQRRATRGAGSLKERKLR
ncbi:hypothetical protein JCM5296_005975 [Sporobolomyces johnsonii]